MERKTVSNLVNSDEEECLVEVEQNPIMYYSSSEEEDDDDEEEEEEEEVVIKGGETEIPVKLRTENANHVSNVSVLNASHQSTVTVSGDSTIGGCKKGPSSVGGSETTKATDSMGRRRFSSSSSSSCAYAIDQDPFKERITPHFNCKELIVFCIDMSNEMSDGTPFRLNDGTKYSPLEMVKRVVELFLRTKNRLDTKHEYGIILLRNTAHWVHHLTNDLEQIVECLEDLTQTRDCDSLNLTSVFETIDSNVKIPNVVNEPKVTPPPYTVRTIVLYGRSNCVPTYDTANPAFKKLLDSPYFFIDVFYIHELPSEENKCEIIFDTLCSLDKKGTSHIVEVSRNATKMHDCMAKLLAHPLQRPQQREVAYRLSQFEG